MKIIFVVPVVVLLLALAGCGLPVLVGAYSILYCLMASAVIWQHKIVPGSIKVIVCCSECHDSIPITPLNRCPEFIDGIERDRNDFKEFSKKHRNHTFHFLSLALGPLRQRGVPWNEPVRTEVFLARGNNTPFLTRRGRIDIKQPLGYQVFPVWHWRAMIFCLAWVLLFLFSPKSKTGKVFLCPPAPVQSPETKE